MHLLEVFAEESDHEFWSDDISLLDRQHFNRDHMVGPKQLTDVYLLGLATKNGGLFATFDREIPRNAANGADARNLVII